MITQFKIERKHMSTTDAAACGWVPDYWVLSVTHDTGINGTRFNQLTTTHRTDDELESFASLIPWAGGIRELMRLARLHGSASLVVGNNQPGENPSCKVS